MGRRMDIIFRRQLAELSPALGTTYNRLGRPIKVNLRQYLQILYIFIDNPPLTCYNIGISVSVHIVWVLRLLGSKLLQATGCPDLLVLLGKPHLLVHVEVHHVLGEQLHGDGVQAVLAQARVPAAHLQVTVLREGGAAMVKYFFKVKYYSKPN